VLGYVLTALVALAVAIWILRSPVFRALVRGRGTDPSQWGSWQEHLEDDGLGPSWRSDGYGGRRETKLYSRHTRRR
jgi:hypothetical protein